MSNNLWVGNLVAGVSDLDLKNIFEKHGVVDVVTCHPLRNYAFVYFKNAQDARRAKDKLQGVVLHGNPLKIDFAKPAKPCKCLWVSCISTSISKEDLEEEFSKFGKIEDFISQQDKFFAIIDYFKQDDAIKALKAMNGKKIGGTVIRVDYSRFHPQRYILPSEGPIWNEELPSNILCISYPPAVHIDEQMLHNALILFGEIEEIRTSIYCSFVEFRSMEEALRAKNGLQGKLFNDPRISITFSRNIRAQSQHFTGTRGPRPGTFVNEIPFHAAQSDAIAQPIGPSIFHGRVVPRGVGGPVSSMRPFAPLDPYFGGPDPSFVPAIGDQNWRPSPSNQMLSSPSASMNPFTMSAPGIWDVFDASQIQREPKRLRSDGHMVIKEMGNHVMLNEQIFSDVPHVNSGVPSNTRFTSGSPKIDRADVGYMWRGILAKGGTSVCRARCVPIGDWIGYEMPEIVNCSARTGLDMLAKHYSDAIGFDIAFFLPDSEEDFASYTEFLQYMGDRNRAGVVKFGDGTTLFLVPPSDFLESVLKVSGPARLYGVVLKFPPHTSDNSSDPTISQQHVNLVPPVTATSTTSVGLSLTPELVASLASLAKVNSNGQQPSGNTVPGPLLKEIQFQGPLLNERQFQGPLLNESQFQGQQLNESQFQGQQLNESQFQGQQLNERQFQGQQLNERQFQGQQLNERQFQGQPLNERQFQGQQLNERQFQGQPLNEGQFQGQPLNERQFQGQQLNERQFQGQQLNERQFQGQIYEHETSNLTGEFMQSNKANDPNLAVTRNSYIQDPSFNLPHKEEVASVTNSGLQTSQGVEFALPVQVTQQYHLNQPHDLHTVGNDVTSSSQVHNTNVYESQSMVPGQQKLEFDADKNQRYQSTLQFAANLLLQIQQKRSGTETDGNH